MNFDKLLLSGSTNGKQIAVLQTSAPGVTVHTTSLAPNVLDEVWLYAVNNGTNTLPVFTQWGSTGSGDLVTANILAGAGRILITDGKLLTSGNVVSCYTSSAGGTFLAVDGFVNRISPDWDGRVVDWALRVVRNGGADPSSVTKWALTNFCYAMTAAGLWPKMVSIVVHVPDNLVAAATPLLPGPGFDPWTNNNFVSGDLTVNGLLGNGSNKYLATGIIANNTIMTSTNAGLTAYVFDALSSTSNYAIGCGGSNNSSQFAIVPRTSGNTTDAYCWRFINVNQDALSVPTLGAGYMSLNRTASNALALYFANSSTAHAAAQTGSIAQSGSIETIQPIAAHAINAVGTITAFSNKRLSFLAIHQGLTASQSLAFFNAVQGVRIQLGGGFV